MLVWFCYWQYCCCCCCCSCSFWSCCCWTAFLAVGKCIKLFRSQYVVWNVSRAQWIFFLTLLVFLLFVGYTASFKLCFFQLAMATTGSWTLTTSPMPPSTPASLGSQRWHHWPTDGCSQGDRRCKTLKKVWHMHTVMVKQQLELCTVCVYNCVSLKKFCL